MRLPHYLKHNIRSESPSQCIFFDTETKDTDISPGNKRLDLSFGMACYTRLLPSGKWSAGDWLRFESPGELWSWVDAKIRHKSKLYMFAHNLVFDLSVSHGFSELPKLGYKLTKAIVDDPPTVLQFKREGKSICLVDTFNYFKSSVKDLGNGIGLPKLDMPSENDPSADWDTYTRRDVEVIKQAMLSYLAFIRDNDMGNFQLTIASQAFTAYRHRFMSAKIFIDNNSKALDLARASYHGGRTEAFYVGGQRGDFYLLDVNSMYPYVMKLAKYPVSLIGVYNRVSPAELSDYLLSYCCVADVTIETDTPVYPVASKAGLLFPIGKIRPILTTPHLNYALGSEQLRRVHRVAVYQRASLFKSYVDTLYSLKENYRSQDNEAFALMAKYLLNTLYGKFGQAGRVYQDIGESDPESVRSWVEIDAHTHQVTMLREFAGIIQAWHSESESFNSHPAISAHVTAYGQCYLWELIKAAGIDNTFYCDTDSLVVNKQGYANLAPYYIGSALGELKLVKRFSNLVIHTLKDYEFDDMIKHKGIRKNAVELAPGEYEQDKFSKFKTMLCRGDLDTMTITRQLKWLRRTYNKGVVTESGRVRPFNYPAEDDLHRWIDKQHEPKIVRDMQSFSDQLEPQYQRLIAEEKRDARRNGEMIYQRGH